MLQVVGARHFSELRAWQKAERLKASIYALTSNGRVIRDRWYCDQLRRASASVSANIAEGFGRFQHADFARFLRMALGSLEEVEQHLRDGVSRGHFPVETLDDLIVEKRHTAGTVVALINYLQRAGQKSSSR